LSTLDHPESLNTILFNDLKNLKEERENIDEILVSWIASLSEEDLEDYLSYQNLAGKSQKKPVGSLISHLFLHQVHHRGQATTLISQSGEGFGETDLLEIIEDFST